MWQAGETIVRREVRNDGWAWLEIPVVGVRDEPELLDVRAREGRFTQDQARDIRAEGRRLEAELATRGRIPDPA